MIVAPGSTSISVDVFFADDTGLALTGKVAADFPACKWSGGTNVASTAIALTDLANIITPHPNDNTAGGIKEREGGWYRLDLPNNMFTTPGRKTLTFAETTNKRIIAPTFDVQYVQSDLRLWLGVVPLALDTQKVQAVTIGGGGGATPAEIWTYGIRTLTTPVVTDRVMLSGILGDQSLADIEHIILPVGPSDNFTLISARIRITSGVAQYQERTIQQWTGATKTVTLDTSWNGPKPEAGDSFQVLYDHAPTVDASTNVAAVAYVASISIVALKEFFNEDTTLTFADAVDGSIVKEIATHSGGTAPTAVEIDSQLSAAHGAGSWLTGSGAAPTAAEIADKLLNRNHEGGSDGGRTVSECLAPNRNKVEDNGDGTFVVFAADDVTPRWTGTLTRSITAGAVTGVDPS